MRYRQNLKKSRKALENQDKENYIDLLRDITFKRIFAYPGNEEFLREILSHILKIEVFDIEIAHDVHLVQDTIKKKLGILDILILVNKCRFVNLEVQKRDLYNTLPRCSTYISKAIADQLEPAQSYLDLKPVTAIWLMNYTLFPYEKDYINHTITVLEKNRNYELNGFQDYYFVELPKFMRKKKNLDDPLEQWLTFISGNYNEEELKEIMSKNVNIKEAKRQVEYLEGDEEYKRIVELQKKYELDWNTSMIMSRQKGIDVGMVQGKAQGKAEGIKETAKKMLKEKLDFATIIKVTGLDKKELEKLK